MFYVRSKGVLGMLAGVLACTVESISYYPTVSQMCEAPPPPLHAINRGIGIEGLGTILAGLWGSGNGTNTFGENVGAIGVTKVRQHINSYRIINKAQVYHQNFVSPIWISNCIFSVFPYNPFQNIFSYDQKNDLLFFRLAVAE